jgi:hypothetical protein
MKKYLVFSAYVSDLAISALSQIGTWKDRAALVSGIIPILAGVLGFAGKSGAPFLSKYLNWPSWINITLVVSGYVLLLLWAAYTKHASLLTEVDTLKQLSIPKLSLDFKADTPTYKFDQSLMGGMRENVFRMKVTNLSDSTACNDVKVQLVNLEGQNTDILPLSLQWMHNITNPIETCTLSPKEHKFIDVVVDNIHPKSEVPREVYIRGIPWRLQLENPNKEYILLIRAYGNNTPPTETTLKLARTSSGSLSLESINKDHAQNNK